jgi:hypothetical protein
LPPCAVQRDASRATTETLPLVETTALRNRLVVAVSPPLTDTRALADTLVESIASTSSDDRFSVAPSIDAPTRLPSRWVCCPVGEATISPSMPPAARSPV